MADDVLAMDGLIEQASAQTGGLDDFGEDSWQEGLDRLLQALRAEADLSPLGEQVAAAMLGGTLAARLWVTDWHVRHPEIGAAPVTAPVVIVGQPRTGTTILFDLLAQDRRLRAPLTWEVAVPNPPPETATYESDPRIAASDASAGMTELLAPGMAAIHPSGARRAQECVAITAGDFRSLQYSTVYRVPSYTRWLLWEADMASAYRYHRRFLQLLQWRHPADRWLLKTPGHLWCLGDFLAAYPDATLLFTHRDPLKVLASVASLTATLQRLGRDETSLPELASEWLDYLAEGNDRAVTARQDGTVAPKQAIDLHFADLMAETFFTIRQVYHRLGLDLDAGTEAAMRKFLADHPADAHGVHRYTWSATGLDEATVRARMARYEDYFGVAREALN